MIRLWKYLNYLKPCRMFAWTPENEVPVCVASNSTRVRCISHAASQIWEQNQKWSYTYGLPKTPLLGTTIGKLLQSTAESIPDKTAVIFSEDGERLTFEQLLRQSDHLAAGLLSLGLKKGDRVGIWGPNSQEWVITQYGTARAGFILVNINPSYRKNELEYVLKNVKWST